MDCQRNGTDFETGSGTARLRIALAIGLALSFLAAACQQGGSSNTVTDTGDTDRTPAGRVGDDEITVGELDTWVKDQLYQRATKGGKETEIYGLRRRAFDQIVGERVLEAEAARRGVEPQALLSEETAKRVSIDEEEVAKLYEENKERFGDRPREEVENAIRSQLSNREQRAAQEAFLAELKDAAGSEFLLDTPRVSIAGTGYSLGKEGALVTVVEFSDYQCPYCKRAEPIVEALLERYPENVRFEYRHFPLEQIHPLARAASEAALCAGEQDRFWDYHRLVFEKTPELADEKLREYAAELGLDAEAFDTCLAENRYRKTVDEDLEAGRKAGVSGTPSFFVNGIPVTGPRNVDAFAEVIDDELAKLGGDS